MTIIIFLHKRMFIKPFVRLRIIKYEVKVTTEVEVLFSLMLEIE
jgi:hypothetical protein